MQQEVYKHASKDRNSRTLLLSHQSHSLHSQLQHWKCCLHFRTMRSSLQVSHVLLPEPCLLMSGLISKPWNGQKAFLNCRNTCRNDQVIILVARMFWKIPFLFVISIWPYRYYKCDTGLQNISWRNKVNPQDTAHPCVIKNKFIRIIIIYTVPDSGNRSQAPIT